MISTKKVVVGAITFAIIIAALTSWLFAGSRYHVGPIDRKIVSDIRTACAARRPCTYTLGRNTGTFDWDKAYVFSAQAERREIEEVLNTRIQSFQEFSSGIAFTNKGTLVHFEQEDIDFENPTPDSLNFDIPEGKTYKSYSPNTLFSVDVERSDRGIYYSLHEWPCKPVPNGKESKICPLPE